MGSFKAYMKADGISGGSTAPGHSGEIDLLSYSLGSQSGGSFGHVGGGSGAGKIDMTQFNFTKLVDATSAIFFTKCSNGEKINKATVTIEKVQDDKNVTVMKYDLDGIYVSSVTIGRSKDSKDPDETPLESIVFNFQKIALQYFQTNP